MGFLHSCRTFARLHQAKSQYDVVMAAHELTYLFWECTLGCNLSCRHCGSRCAPGAAGSRDLSGAEAKRVFREIAEDFAPSQIMLAISGGEPLTRADLFDVMASARALGFHWGMVTNATLITEKTIRQMEESGMSTVSVSIDGDDGAHAALRGSPEAHKASMEGLRILLEKADFLASRQVTTVVYSGNVGLLDKMYDTFAGMGVREWRLLMIEPIGRMLDPENQELLITGGQLGRLLDFIAAKRKSGPMAVTFQESGFLGLKYEGKVRDAYFHCPAGINVGSVLHDGAIGACPSIERSMVEGDVRKERFSHVWNTRFQRYRDRNGHRRKGSCHVCKWWNYCEGGSLHLWDWEHGEPRICHHQMLKEANCL